MADRFDGILDECISRIVLQGESVEDCLRLYPDLAAELEPELRVVAVAHDTYTPRPAAKDRARDALFAAMASEQTAPVEAQTEHPHPSPLPQGRGNVWGWLQSRNGHRNGFDQVLDDCVTDIVLRGESVQDCLDRYPAYAAQLAPQLWVVARFQQAYTFTPLAESKVRARTALHQAIRDVEQAPSPAGFTFPWFTSMRWAGSLAAVALAAVVTAGGSAYASQDALPGDPLYPVKAAIEDLQVTLAPTEEAKAAILVQLTEKRVEEIQKAAEFGRPDAVVQATELFEKQVTQATQNLDQAAAKGKDVGSIDAALDRKIEQARRAVAGVAVEAPPEVQRALTTAVDTTEKKKQERTNRPPRPQNQNRGGNGNNSGSAGAAPAGPGGGAGAVIPPTSTPRPQERQAPQRVAPTAKPPDEPANDRPLPRPTERDERERERQERERLERQRAQDQRERLERERAAQGERERLEREREERVERERDRQEQEREEAREREKEEREERERIERERERAEERREKEREERQRAEQERREKERQERQRTVTPTPSPSPSATKAPTPRPTAVADRDKNQEKEKDRRAR